MQTINSYDGSSFISTTEEIQKKLNEGYKVVSMMTTGCRLYVVYNDPPTPAPMPKPQILSL